MKEITVLSGKGGTGKTTITAALASVADTAIFCDNDVDAADLHLIFHPLIEERYTFASGWEMTIDPDRCIKCGKCEELCRFNAISHTSESGYVINNFKCEGCLLCERVCPVNAITSHQRKDNLWFVSQTRFGHLVHAQMGPGEENSGRLVTTIRKRAKELAEEKNIEYIINDGPPGIGCATIASLTGADIVLLVIEPTKSGLHDAQRLVSLAQSFKIKCFALINKADILEEMTLKVERYLKEEGIPLLTKINFDEQIVSAMTAGKTVVEYDPESKLSMQLKEVWNQMINNSN